MKFKLAIIALIAVLAASLYAAPPSSRRSAPPLAARVDNATYIDANRILMFVTNHGNFGRDLTDMFHQDAGTFYPYSTVDQILSGANNGYVLYAAGLWIGGNVNGENRVTVAEYSDEYVPGPMADSTFMEDSPEFKVYKLYRDSLADNPNADYENWPADMGAPVNEDGTPAMMGDQMLWAVYNDADTSQHSNDAGDTDPLGIEVRHTTFAFDQEGSLGDIIFFRLQIYNRGENTINNCFFSLWADPDLGGYTDDLVGCDTTRSLGYVYNGANVDATYGSAPPSLGFDFFQGPLIETGDMADTALMWGDTIPGFVNMGMTSFNKYINGTDPISAEESYNYMQGLEASGLPYEFEGEELKFVHTGNPVTGDGDLDDTPGDRRWMQTTGPLTFAPGDSTEIIAAIVVGRGGNRFQSIDVVKAVSDFAQRIYENGFKVNEPPAAPKVHITVAPGEIALSWDSTSEVSPGAFPFRGYTVSQCDSESGENCVELATFDVIDSFAQVIVDTLFDNYSQTLQPDVKRAVTNSGLKYVYITDQDAINSQALYNVSTYYFRVSAFSFAERDSTGLPVPYTNRFLERSTAVTITPQDYLPGVDPAGNVGDVLPVDHISGGSDVLVEPYILDPLALNGHTYKVWFSEIGVGEDIDTAWNLMDVTTGDTLLKDRMNYSGEDGGEEPYFPFDGFQLKVTSASGVVQIRETAGADGPIVPSDNVMYSLNSTRDWYVDTSPSGDFSRMNWRSVIGVYDWEFRFTTDSSEFYLHSGGNMVKSPYKAPFELWNIGQDTPDDPSDDERVQFSVLDATEVPDSQWNYGDLVYVWEYEYAEPLADPSTFINADGVTRLGRVIFADNSGETTSPATGTVVRFITAKVPTPADTFTFVAQAPGFAADPKELDDIRVVPNPFYMFGPYDTNVGSKTIRFFGLPAECTIEIYNLGGEFVDRIRKNDPSTSIAEWPALTQNGLPVSSGIYLYVVDAPGFGQKVGKFAVFTATEVLKQY